MPVSPRRPGRLPLFMILPVLVSAGLVAFMFYWNGRQAEVLADWWRERTARAVWEAVPRMAGCSPRELIEHPELALAALPKSGIRAIGFTNAHGWVVEPLGPDSERLKTLGPFPAPGVTCLHGENLILAKFSLRGGGPPRRELPEIAIATAESQVNSGSGNEQESPGGRGFGNGRGNGPGGGRGRGMGGHFETSSEQESPSMPGGGPFEAVFLLPETSSPPVVPLVVQRWLWPMVWVIGSILWIVILRHRERLSSLERDRQREAHLAVVGQATARLAHEIKNPLGAIRGAAQHVLSKPLSDTQQEMVRLIEQETCRLEELARGVLDFARPPTLRVAECNMSALIRDVRSIMLLRSASPEIRLIGLDETVLVRCDPAAMTQILQNLLENARAAMGNTPGSESIEVVVERSGKALTIQVLDRGEGLSDDARVHLFEPFFSTKVHGYGLGLVVSRRLAEAHGGALSVLPRDGGGCIAELRIPCEEES